MRPSWNKRFISFDHVLSLRMRSWMTEKDKTMKSKQDEYIKRPEISCPGVQERRQPLREFHEAQVLIITE